MVFIETNSSIGTIINAFTTNITGNIYLSLFFLLVIILVFALVLRLDNLPIALILLPLSLVLVVQFSAFLLVVGVLSLIMAGVLIKLIFSFG